MPAIQLKNQVKVGISASVNDTEALEIYILDALYDRWEYDWTTGEVTETNWVPDIIAQVNTIKPKKINMTIDCAGGDAGIGLALYSFLKNCNAKVFVDVVGMAGSAASIVMQAASKGNRKIARNGFVVIHRAWGEGYGNSEDLRAAADVIDMYTGQYVDIYSQSTGKTPEIIGGLIANGDYWMTGTDAVTEGFADETYNDNPQFAIAARIQTLSPEYRNIPQNLISADITETTEEGGLLNSLKKDFMDFKTQVNAFLDKFKKGSVKADAANIPEAVANIMAEPMTEMMGTLQTEVKADIDGLETKVGNTIDEKIKAAIEPLKETIKTLQDANAQLETDLAEKIGGESTTNPKAELGGIKPIGKGVKATV